jgi:hypothetical protein
MADMLKFFKGLEASLPASGVNGAIYITTDEGGIYLGTGTGMKRLGDFVQVANVAALPAKAHENCLYYCVAENILAKWNGTEWKQINKQPTAEELKTLLGLGSMAYLSEVAEANLSAALAEKVNAAAEGNHSHANKGVLDGITAEKVAAWDAAEGNAKGYADGLDAAMDARVDVIEAALGENGSVAASIKAAVDALDFTDTAVDGEYVSAVNEVDGKISVTRKALPDYSNTYEAKGAAATALDNAKAYADGLAANYDEKGAAAGVQTALEAEIAKKVDKVEGKSLISDSEIARLATLANYDDTQVKADIAKKADAETMTAELGKKVDKVDGKDLIATSEIERLATLKNYDDTALAGRVTTAEGKITALETESAKHALKTEVEAVDAKFANYKTAEAQKAIDDEQDRRLGVIEGDYLKAADIANFETKENVKKVADDLAAYIESNDEALDEVRGIADAARTEDEVNSQIDAKITALKLGETYEPIGAEDRAKAYVDQKFTDADLAQYTTEAEVKSIVDGVIAGAADSETYNSLTKLVDYIDAHGGEASEMAQAIETLEGDVKGLKEAPSAGIKASDIEAWNGEIGAKALAETKTTTAEVKAQIEEYGYATTGYADGKAAEAKAAAEKTASDALAAARTEISAEIDADVKAVNDAFNYYKITNDAAVALKANSADVYTKTETFTKDEVNAAIAAAVEAAHTWGEF